MKTLLVLIIACALSIAAVADDKAPYMVEVKARQVRGEPLAGENPAGEVIIVEAKITENKKDGSVLSAPRLTMRDGSQAQIAVGEPRPDPQPGAGAQDNATDAAGIASGLKVDVIKPLGGPQILVVTMILKDGKVVWADSQWCKVDPAKP